MATTTVLESFTPLIFKPKPMRVCFSYAAYAKNLIHYLKSSNIHVDKGLTDAEFSSIESRFQFSFPPDLRSILQEGLPLGHGFPNWRSSSKQELQVLINLPVEEICKQVETSSFWLDSWGNRPEVVDRALCLAKLFIKKSPVLVPIYRCFYIPARPWVSGNPVFYVHGGEVKLWSFDLAGFFQQVEFKGEDIDGVLRRPTLLKLLNSPPWAATEARRVEFWTELVNRKERMAATDDGCRWWSKELSGCFEDVCSMLRNGGWKEEEVREMMMINGCDELDQGNNNSNIKYTSLIDKERLSWHLRLLSKRLLRAGWSMEDVVDSLGILEDYHHQNAGNGDGVDSLFDFNCIHGATRWL